MIDSLFGKVFLILTLQLTVTWLAVDQAMRFFHRRYQTKDSRVTGTKAADGTLDLDLAPRAFLKEFIALIVLDIACFGLMFTRGISDLRLGLPLLLLWSVCTGLLLAFKLIRHDETLGGRVLRLTAMLVLGSWILGGRSGLDLSFLERPLAIMLALLLLVLFFRILFQIPRHKDRFTSFLGVVTFTGYLLLDFNRLTKFDQENVANTWNAAAVLSIDLYLDIINLFLQLLDALDDL